MANKRTVEHRSNSHVPGLNLDIKELSISDTERKNNESIGSDSDLGFSVGKSIKDAGPVNEVVEEQQKKIPELVEIFEV